VHAVDVVEDRGHLADLAWRLGNLEAEVGHWSQASKAFETSIASGRSIAESFYFLALSRLAEGDSAGLRRGNSALLADLGTPNDPELCNSVAWSCVLAAEAVADVQAPVRLAQLAVDGAPESDKPTCLSTLGAALYRAGRFDDAMRRLEEGIQWRNGASLPQEWVFLALAHDRLGHREQALHWLQKLRRHHPTQQPNSFWSELELRLFTSEAEAVILYDPIFPTDPFAH
jgi:uncharacterized protein HemY